MHVQLGLHNSGDYLKNQLLSGRQSTLGLVEPSKIELSTGDLVGGIFFFSRSDMPYSRTFLQNMVAQAKAVLSWVVIVCYIKDMETSSI